MERITHTPTLLVGILPRGPIAPPTPEEITAAHEFQAAERHRLAMQGVVFSDVNGDGALVAVLRGER